MKPPKSAGKRVQWAIRFMGDEEVISGLYLDRSKPESLLPDWKRNHPESHYELVKITTEPVAETKKRKSK